MHSGFMPMHLFGGMVGVVHSWSMHCSTQSISDRLCTHYSLFIYL